MWSLRRPMRVASARTASLGRGVSQRRTRRSISGLSERSTLKTAAPEPFSLGMVCRWIFAGLLALAGCTPGFRTLRLQPDSPEMRDALTRAVATWEAAGLAEGAVEIVDAGGARAAFVASTRQQCGPVPGDYPGDESEQSECARSYPDRSARFLLVLERFQGSACETQLVEHALGHLLNPDGDHASGGAVMARFMTCADLPLNDADVAFGCASAPCFGE